MQNSERLTLTLPEVAKALGISRGLVYQLAKEGRLPVIRLGKRLLVPKVALSRLLEGNGKTEDSTS